MPVHFLLTYLPNEQKQRLDLTHLAMVCFTTFPFLGDQLQFHITVIYNISNLTGSLTTNTVQGLPGSQIAVATINEIVVHIPFGKRYGEGSLFRIICSFRMRTIFSDWFSTSSIYTRYCTYPISNGINEVFLVI